VAVHPGPHQVQQPEHELSGVVLEASEASVVLYVGNDWIQESRTGRGHRPPGFQIKVGRNASASLVHDAANHVYDVVVIFVRTRLVVYKFGL
jgi:hypothetical protein